jgi:phage terminase large subunit-like protein
MTTLQWSTACPDWERRIVAGESLVPCAPLFPDQAEYALNIFCALRIYNLPGQPTMGEACRPWVFDLVRAIFGAYDPEEGRRLITEFLVHVAKKNTKSFLASGIMLTATIINWRMGAEFLILAPTIEVAGNSYTPARWMIRLDPELDALFHVQDHLRTITHRDNGTVLKVVAADKDTVSGKIGTITLVDELWLFGEKPNAENMLIEATGGQASRPEGCTIMLTTQSDKAPAGVFAKKLQYARDVRDGKIDDPTFMPILYEFPKHMIADESYKDPKNFYITNPNLGLSVDIPFIERKFKQAEAGGKDSLCGFLAKHLNVEIGLVMQSERWAGADCWEKAPIMLDGVMVGQRSNIDKGLTLETIIERSDVIVIGGDGGGLDDLLGMCVLGRDRHDQELWRAYFRAWVHPIALDRRKENITIYQKLRDAGDLTIVDEMEQDVREFCAIVETCEESGLLDRVGLDPSGTSAPAQALNLLGYDEKRVVGIKQGWQLNSAIIDCERKLAGGKLQHGGQQLMQWCVGNARQEIKGSNRYITKEASGLGKVDPVLAMLNAVFMMSLNPEPRNPVSRYETHGIQVF